MRWQLRIPFGTIEIMEWQELRPAEIAWSIRDASDALRLLRPCQGDLPHMTLLRAVLVNQDVGVDPSGLTDAEVLEQLAWRIAGGQLLVVPAAWKDRRGGSAAGPGEAVEESTTGAEPTGITRTPVGSPVAETRTWIEIEMVDEDGAPVASERYEVVLTDGSTRRGSLDSLGRVRFDNLVPGSCQIRFPELDAKTWGPL